MSSNFDFVAPFYDRLSSLVFGKNLERVQRVHLHFIQPKAEVLIIGGGSGEILKWLPNDCHVTFLEKSSVMIKQARAKGMANFLQIDFLEYQTTETYDWVICPFFLDCFNHSNLQVILKKLSVLVAKNGRLLVIDFYNDRRLKTRFLLWLMHRFFRVTTGISSMELSDIHKAVFKSGFEDLHYQKAASSTFSAVYAHSQPTYSN